MKSVQGSAALTIAGMLILGISGGYAQSNLASVSGVVSDPKGAVVPAAVVSATNTETGVDTKTATDAAGFYAIRNLPIGAGDDLDHGTVARSRRAARAWRV
jgi:hypothetical protein